MVRAADKWRIRVFPKIFIYSKSIHELMPPTVPLSFYYFNAEHYVTVSIFPQCFFLTMTTIFTFKGGIVTSDEKRYSVHHFQKVLE